MSIALCLQQKSVNGAYAYFAQPIKHGVCLVEVPGFEMTIADKPHLIDCDSVTGLATMTTFVHVIEIGMSFGFDTDVMDAAVAGEGAGAFDLKGFH